MRTLKSESTADLLDVCSRGCCSESLYLLKIGHVYLPVVEEVDFVGILPLKPDCISYHVYWGLMAPSYSECQTLESLIGKFSAFYDYDAFWCEVFDTGMKQVSELFEEV